MTTAPPGILPVIAIDRTSGKPLYRQLYEGYREAIVERRLRAGQRLPSTRSLAVELGVSRIPVLNAFVLQGEPRIMTADPNPSADQWLFYRRRSEKARLRFHVT